MPTNTLGPTSLSFSPDSRYLAVLGDFNTNGLDELHVFDVLTGVRTAIVTPATGNVASFGWTGATQLVLRANLAFRGVAIPAGQHQVVFSYRNPDVVRAWMLGGICLLLTALLGGVAIWRKW